MNYYNKKNYQKANFKKPQKSKSRAVVKWEQVNGFSHENLCNCNCL